MSSTSDSKDEAGNPSVSAEDKVIASASVVIASVTVDEHNAKDSPQSNAPKNGSSEQEDHVTYNNEGKQNEDSKEDNGDAGQFQEGEHEELETEVSKEPVSQTVEADGDRTVDEKKNERQDEGKGEDRADDDNESEAGAKAVDADEVNVDANEQNNENQTEDRVDNAYESESGDRDGGDENGVQASEETQGKNSEKPDTRKKATRKVKRFDTGVEVEPHDPLAKSQQAFIQKNPATTPLEIALAAELARKNLQIGKLTSEVVKLKQFISKRKQTYKRKRKENGAPTRALSAYNIFVQDRFEQLAKQNEQALMNSDSDTKMKRVPPSSLVAKTGNEWRELPEEEKKVYEERAKADKKRYNEEMAKYQPPEKQANKKRNKTGYNMFFSAHVLRLKQSETGVPSERGSVARLVGNAWKELSADEKQFYELQADSANDEVLSDNEDDELKETEKRQTEYDPAPGHMAIDPNHRMPHGPVVHQPTPHDPRSPPYPHPPPGHYPAYPYPYDFYPPMPPPPPPGPRGQGRHPGPPHPYYPHPHFPPPPPYHEHHQPPPADDM